MDLSILIKNSSLGAVIEELLLPEVLEVGVREFDSSSGPTAVRLTHALRAMVSACKLSAEQISFDRPLEAYTVRELRALCTAHRVRYSRSDTKGSLVKRLRTEQYLRERYG